MRTGEGNPADAGEVVRNAARIEAPAGLLFDLAADLPGWPQRHRPAVHAEYLENDPSGARVQHWSLVGEQSVRTWRAAWRFDREQLRIESDRERDTATEPRIRATWTFEPMDAGSTVVTLAQELALADGTTEPSTETSTEPAATLTRELERDARLQLESLRTAGERHAELSDLVLSFSDSLFAAGRLHDAYTYLYEADRWPERIPHVSSLKLVEETPNIQFFDMHTATPDGTPHTTRSVRICLPERRIVYKQIRPPEMLEAHTGHWAFTEEPEGVLLTARHTATIRPDALALFGGATTVAGARRYTRRALGRNSMSNLWLAKDWAEELADA